MGVAMAQARFFEGPEKKVELVVTSDFPSLRSLGGPVWRRVVDAAGAEILSVLRSEQCDGYLLSESSLFVFDDRFVAITCGQTTLVDAVQEVMRTIPPEAVAFMVYERKNEHYPEHQPTNFYDDARRLRSILPGRALRFGDEHGHYVQMFHTTRPFFPKAGDPKLEVLMHAIDPEVAERFVGGPQRPDAKMAASLGLEPILPGFVTSEHVFKPRGYSLNALKGCRYYAVHVTPEQTGSYVSFETNFDFRSQPSELVGAVVELFQPRAFDVLMFLAGDEPRLSVQGYLLGDHVVDRLGGYQVGYFQYFVPPGGSRPPEELVL